MNLKSLATYKDDLLCIICNKVYAHKKGIKTDKGDICEDHLATTEWNWTTLRQANP